ncbi:MAG TPA: molybdenum cofactor guanylyltransferase [Actinomycetota bacterium]|nr:molybdenum cofactor guanylyltransferase [Actinomycetota bacterium]
MAGVVLAGGRSTRFGRNKLAEPYRGMPLLHHAALRLGEVCGRIVLVLAPEAAEPSMPPGVDVLIARDPTEGEGPLAGLHAGLLAAPSDLALVAAGDMPDLQTRVLLELLQVADQAPVDAVALQDGDRYRPLPCVVRSAAAADAGHTLLHAGRRALRDLLDALRVAVIDEATWVALDPGRRTLFDVDVPSDLDE